MIETNSKISERYFRCYEKRSFFAAIAKCSFMRDSVLFLGYVVSKEGLLVDESMVVAVKN
jgi:hypothetical protein